MNPSPVERATFPKLFFLWSTLLCHLVVCQTVPAQEPIVRSHPETKGTVWVGQKVTVVVELLAPGFFSSPVSFDLPDPQGVLLLPPTGNPIMSSETIKETRYTVQRHELSAYPMRAGQLSIPAMTFRFSFKHAPLDAKDISADVTTKPMTITVESPPGSQGLGQVISCRDLKIAETWKPVPANTAVPAGAAFTRTITFTAPDVPGMLFPPVPADPIDGLGIYTRRQVLDHTDDGSLHGERRDEITYVCQRPGEFVIPAVRFTWFDLDTKQLQTTDLAERTLKVIANPALASTTGASSAPAQSSSDWWIPTALVTAVLLLLWMSRTATLRRVLSQAFAPFRPLHLQALNPTDPSRR